MIPNLPTFPSTLGRASSSADVKEKLRRQDSGSDLWSFLSKKTEDLLYRATHVSPIGRLHQQGEQLRALGSHYSMFIWYRKYTICYAYLADVPEDDAHERFPQSRWFTRGWTLQELIALRFLVLLTSECRTMDTKTAMAWEVEKITDTDYLALVDRQSLDEVRVARRMSWASKRQTTKVEDEAYSLLGIFNIKLPTVCRDGRGAFRSAFWRLQEEITRRIPDQSILALGGIPPVTAALISSNMDLDVSKFGNLDGFVASSPRDFDRAIRPVSFDEFRRRCGNMTNLPLLGFQSSPYGILRRISHATILRIH